jgi:hypothetical protein
MEAILHSKFPGFGQDEIARYFDKDGNPTIEHPDRINEASDEELKGLMQNPEVLEVTKELISLIEERRLNYREAEKRFTMPSVNQQYPKEYNMPSKPIFFDLTTNKYWIQKDGFWYHSSSFGLDQYQQRAGQKRAVQFAGELAGYPEGWWALSPSMDVLVTKGRDEIDPVYSDEGNADKTWNFLLKVLGEEQFYVLADCLISAAQPKHWWDRVLVLVGDRDAGRLVQRIITHLVGGRSMDAEKWLTNPRFNDREIGVEHLVYVGRLAPSMARFPME